MTMMLFLISGLALLVLGGELLVDGSVHLAQRLRVSTLAIGLTIVAFGTGAPELAVSIYAVFTGVPDIAIGNVIGSNIINILLVLGLSAIIRPIVVNAKLVQIDVPIVIAISMLFYFMALNGHVSRLNGAVLFAGMLVYTWYCFWSEKRKPSDEQEEFSPSKYHWSIELLMVLVSFALLVIGAELLVKGAVMMAKVFGVSDLVIGLTIVAIGTSLPEMFASLSSIIREQRDLAAGNIIGSNVFNILGVVGLTALVSPTGLQVAPNAIAFDLPVMIAVAFACMPLFLMEHKIARWQGFLFVFYYISYTAYLILDAMQHAVLVNFSNALLYFCLPLTVITIAVIAARSSAHRGDFY